MFKVFNHNRFHKLLLLSSALLLFNFSNAQQNFDAWNDPKYKQAEVISEYMTADEKELYKLINLARMNGKLFRDTYLSAYQDTSSKTPSEKSITSLRKDLKKYKNLRPLIPAKNLTDSARAHAIDLGNAGKYGHTSSKGVEFKTRMDKLVERYAGVGENCAYGNDKPLAILMDMLIDDGNKSRGHRKNILQTRFEYMGLAIEPHTKDKFNAVLLFAGPKKY